MSTLYDAAFYREQSAGSRQSAQQVVPLLLQAFAPRSVVDLGCGIGTWLSVVRELGVEDVLGLDGDYVDRSNLQIPGEQFIPADFRKAVPTARQFDMAMCLEVAEHLPEDTAQGLITHLTKLAPLVAFSAAIPGQGGTDHVNERWQDYWRAGFLAQGYRAVDLIRPQVWQNDKVDFWYAQNLIVYASAEAISLHALTPVEPHISLNLVHPRQLTAARDEGRLYLSKALSMLPELLGKTVRRRLGLNSTPQGA